jgi:predicted CoA-binding protein
MKSFYKELEKAKKTLIKNLWIQKGILDDEWFHDQITTKEYVVRDEELKKRIKMLES